MSMRSATNKRTQNREYAGATRKSAASAKPARAAAGSVRVVPASAKERRREAERGESLEGLSREEKKARKREARIREDRLYSVASILMKDDPDYKRLRRVFWVLLALGMVAILVIWVLLFGLSDSTGEMTSAAQLAGVVVAYALVIGAFVYDFVKIRPLRNYYRAQAEGMSDRKLVEIIERDAAKRDKKDAKKDEAVAAPAAESAKPAKKKKYKNNRSRH